MNDEQYSLIKYTGTALLQSFSHLNTEFEVRLSKDKRTILICVDGINFSLTNMVAEVQHKLNRDEQWYLALNWSDLPEFINVVLPEKKQFLNEQ